MIVCVDRLFTLLGALSGLTAVALGAFGAHALHGRLSPEMLAIFETGVRYQMYHALALVLTSAIVGHVGATRLLASAGWCFTAGTVLFSGSLYLLALTGLRIVGAITPLGGVAFLAGWACLALAAATH
jgi:uncharacterized membrane protein YgdD (TMEM256/DUF423 family)